MKWRAILILSLLFVGGEGSASTQLSGGSGAGSLLAREVPWVGQFTSRHLLTSSDSHSAYSSSTDYIELTGIDTTSGYQADCDDLQIYYWNGTVNTQVKRKVTGCNSSSTKVYFKIPYALTVNQDLNVGPTSRLYLYHNDASATCSTGCSDYVNTNFPQAALTPAASTQILYDFETTSGCNVCTGDASYNERGCSSNGDCGTGTCTDTLELCDISGIQTPHHLNPCNNGGTDCSADPNPSYAASARIGDKAISCTSGGTSYRAIEPNFDDSAFDIVTIDWWVNNKHTQNSTGARRPWGTDSGLRLRYADVDQYGTNWQDSYYYCDDALADKAGTCTDNNDCCFSSEPHPCGVDGICDRNGMLLIDVLNTQFNSWGDENRVPYDTWTHYRWVVDDESPDVNRWRGWKNGVAINYQGSSGWLSPDDCTATPGNPYICCTGVDAGCGPIVNIANTTSNFLYCNTPGGTTMWHEGDELRISTADLGAPDWVSDQVTAVVGTLESLVQPGVAPTNWGPNLDMVLLFEENTGDTALDSGANSDDDWTDTETLDIQRDASVYTEGAKSAKSVGGDYSMLRCNDANCPGIDYPTDQAGVTITFWLRLAAAPTTRSNIVNKYVFNESGYWVYIEGSDVNDPARCAAYASGVGVNAAWDTSGISADTWYHYACTIEDKGTTLENTIYRNGTADTASSNTLNFTTHSSQAQIIQGDVTTLWVDEVVIDGVAWTAAQIARQCSIGVEGSLGRCDSGTPANYLACNSNADCGGIALCATGASATDNTYCVEGTKAGCCMGRNVSHCGGNDLAACNASAP